MEVIRKATVSDVKVLLPLVADYWSFEGVRDFEAERVAAQLTRLLAESRLGAGWIGVASGAPAGYLLAVYVFSLEHLGFTAEIDEFFVLPSQRGQGVGRELLRVAETEFTLVGCTNVSLQLSRDNDVARAFYRRHAYNERSGYELLDKSLVDG